MDKKTASEILQDRTVNGLSYRSLGKKYNLPLATIHRLIMGKPEKRAKIPAAESLPEDINLLKEELRKARLKIELQDLMLDISSKELGYGCL